MPPHPDNTTTGPISLAPDTIVLGNRLVRFLMLSRRLEDEFDLLQMIDVMARHHVQDALDGFLAAFGMQAVMFPLLGLQPLEHSEVGFAHGAKNFQALARVAFVVPAGRDPRILVVGLDRSSWRTENRADAPRGDNFGVAEMREDFRHRPFVGCRPLAKFRR